MKNIAVPLPKRLKESDAALRKKIRPNEAFLGRNSYTSRL